MEMRNQFMPHKLSRSQCKWSVLEKEAFAIHFALQKLDYYLHNSQFVNRTDHKPLDYLLESPMQNKKIQLWALSMSDYNYTINTLLVLQIHVLICFQDIQTMLRKLQIIRISKKLKIRQSLMLMTICMRSMYLIPLSLNQNHLQTVICELMSHLKSMIVQKRCFLYEM